MKFRIRRRDMFGAPIDCFTSTTGEHRVLTIARETTSVRKDRDPGDHEWRKFSRGKNDLYSDNDLYDWTNDRTYTNAGNPGWRREE